MPTVSDTGRPMPIIFFKSSAGHEPVREWLKSLSVEDRRTIGEDLQTVQWGWPMGMPLCRSLGHGLWEVRTALAGHRIARVILCFHERRIFALHGFIKKTQQTPVADLQLARDRQQEVKS